MTDKLPENKILTDINYTTYIWYFIEKDHQWSTKSIYLTKVTNQTLCDPLV
jgi:hypothetical protein